MSKHHFKTISSIFLNSLQMNKLFLFSCCLFLTFSCKENKTTSECSCNADKTIINDGLIEGYTDKISYFPEEEIKIYISSKQEQVKISLIVHSLEQEVIATTHVSDAQVQHYTQCSFQDGCNWKESAVLKIPNHVNASYASILIENDEAAFQIPLIIKNDVKNDVLCIASTNTWQAYNTWGGGSFYSYNFDDCTDKYFNSTVSFQRPISIIGDLDYSGHLFDAELALAHWFEKSEIKFDLLSDVDIHNNPEILTQYKVVFLNTHPEYWSAPAMDGIENYLNNGGNICCLGANVFYWKVVINNNKIECLKEGGIHSDGSNGGLWRNNNRFEESLIGTSYTRAGYNTFMPYVVLNSDHWLFENTGLKNGDLFGFSVNRKYASGHETDKITNQSPENIELIARGLNQEAFDEFGQIDADRNGGANMIFYKSKGGGMVFNASSITSSGSPLVDSTMNTILLNYLKKCLD